MTKEELMKMAKEGADFMSRSLDNSLGLSRWIEPILNDYVTRAYEQGKEDGWNDKKKKKEQNETILSR